MIFEERQVRKLHTTGRLLMPPPRSRASVRFHGRRRSLLDEIRGLPAERCQRDGTALKADFVRFVEDRWDEEHNRPRAMFRWVTPVEAWIDFLSERKNVEAFRRAA